MMEKLLMNVSLFIKQGDDELINILEDNYLSVFKDYHYQFNNDEQMQNYYLYIGNVIRNQG